jgi:CheY-like chemotaxis protein
VKKLAELFQGRVEVESTKGTGTVVTCKLQFERGEAGKMHSDGPEQLEVKLPEGFRVLVADDEEYNCRLITTILDKWHADYDVVMNGVDAVHRLSDRVYDLVLMDLRMPGVSGVDATRFIRETLKKTGQELPVFGITADTSYQRDSVEGELFNAFLIKPFTESQLSKLVAEVLGQAGSPSGPQNEFEKLPLEQQQGDLSNLVRMSGDDMDFVEEMIIQFEKTTLKGLDEMESAVEEGRYGTVRELAHKLVPPGRHLGLSRFVEQLADIEMKAPRGNKVLLRELISQARKSSQEAGESLHLQFRQIK